MLILQSKPLQQSNESNEIKHIISECNTLDCIILSAMESMLYSAPFRSQRCTVRYLSSEPVCQRCESGIVEFSFSAGKIFSQSSHSASLSSVSVLYQRPPFPALAPWHAVDNSFYRSPERTQLQCMLPLTCKNIYTYCTVHSLHTRLRKVNYGAKMKVIVLRCHEPKTTSNTSWGQKERYEEMAGIVLELQVH